MMIEEQKQKLAERTELDNDIVNYDELAAEIRHLESLAKVLGWL
jgi:hypothetical protein